MKDAFKIVLSMLVISIMLIGTVGAESTDSTQDELIEGEYYFPDYGVNTFELLKADSNVIATKGNVPEITEDKEKLEWLASLNSSIYRSQSELHPYMKEFGGPLAGFGYSYEGYIFVDIDAESKETIDESIIEKIYTIINEDGKSLGLKEIPVVFSIASIEETSRTSDWTTLVGGIKVSSITGSTTSSSTLSFAAKDSSGNKGFVMSGHAAKSAGLGNPIYQAVSPRQVGVVGYYNGVFADAAWVSASNVADDVYYANTDYTKDVAGYYTNVSLGTSVYMSGITSGRKAGTVDRFYDEIDSDSFGTLYSQFRATYPCDHGDSGAPVFVNYGSSSVKLVGVNRATDDVTGKSYFSPIGGVIADLGVTPLK